MNTGKTEVMEFYESLVADLCSQRNGDGFWEGRLSSSALAAAVALTAMKLQGDSSLSGHIAAAAGWIIDHQNVDGGYGDTPESESNISTSLLCYGALFLCMAEDKRCNTALDRLLRYFSKNKIDVSNDVESSILSHYGKDFTFSVPILAMLAICGVVPDFEKIPQLPFELSLLPSRFFRFLKLQVVSYAIPALIAVGVLCFIRRRRGFILLHLLRRAMLPAALKKLESLMPESGGFLEAIPLTAFVAMSLSASIPASGVIGRGIGFLAGVQREDGGFPIDTNLSTWVTTLSVKALGTEITKCIRQDDRQRLRTHLLSLQYVDVHPFNGAAAGGWAWNGADGAVPDADDTPGSILALLELYEGSARETDAILRGCDWLVSMQNSDGGIPTFCRGWGQLPFDRSCADLTGHAIAAVSRSADILVTSIPPSKKKAYGIFLDRALRYLAAQQYADGSWLPLWFGNQGNIMHRNPVYGSARVSVYLSDTLVHIKERSRRSLVEVMLARGVDYLVLNCNADGGWGAQRGVPSTQEETALALCALVSGGYEGKEIQAGFSWMIRNVKKSGISPSPIGLYFASLWYDEKLYPHIFMVDACRRYLASL